MREARGGRGEERGSATREAAPIVIDSAEMFSDWAQLEKCTMRQADSRAPRTTIDAWSPSPARAALRGPPLFPAAHTFSRRGFGFWRDAEE